MYRCALTALLFLLLCSVARATTYYTAATGGNDSNTCVQAQTIGTAKATIGGGVLCLASGDTLLVRTGTYTEAGIGSGTHVIPNGTVGAYTTIQNYNGEVVTFDLEYTAQRGYGFNFTAALVEYIKIAGFTMDGAGGGANNAIASIAAEGRYITIQNVTISGTGTTGHGIFVVNSNHHWTVRNVSIDGSLQTTSQAHAIYFSGDDSLFDGVTAFNCPSVNVQLFDSTPNVGADRNTFKNSTIRNSGGDGIAIDGSDNLIYNNLIRTNGGNGLYIGYNPGSANNKVYNNTIEANGNNGIDIGIEGTQTANLIKNNILSNNTSYGIRLRSGSLNTVYQYNLTYLNGIAAILDNGTGTTNSNNTAGDPAYIGGGNYHIQASGAADEIGLNLTSVFTDDIDGQARPSGGAWDVGYDEIIVADNPPAGCAPSGGTVTFDAVSSGSAAPGSTLTIAHTITASGANRALFVFATDASDNVFTITGVTYNGVAMTLHGSKVVGLSDQDGVYLFKLVNPTTGTNNIVITSSGSQRLVGGGLSFTNVHQTTPLGTAGTNNATADSSSIDISSNANEIVIDGIAIHYDRTANNVGAGQTSRWNILTGVASGDVNGAASTEGGAATTTMSWSGHGATYQAHLAVAVKASAAIACSSGGAMLMGMVGN